MISRDEDEEEVVIDQDDQDVAIDLSEMVKGTWVWSSNDDKFATRINFFEENCEISTSDGPHMEWSV